MELVYLSLGSNLGDREGMLQAAVDALNGPRLRVLRLSPVYETEPVGEVAQPWFLNMVVEAETRLPPQELLAWIAEVERRLGRRRSLKEGPRTIDVDVLFYGNLVLNEPALEIPHPRLAGRRFVLCPMADLRPGFQDPVTGWTVRSLLEDTTGQEARRVSFSPVLRAQAK